MKEKGKKRKGSFSINSMKDSQEISLNAKKGVEKCLFRKCYCFCFKKHKATEIYSETSMKCKHQPSEVVTFGEK